MRTDPQLCGSAMLFVCLLAGGVAAGLSGSRIDQLTGELDISTDQCVSLCSDFLPTSQIHVCVRGCVYYTIEYLVHVQTDPDSDYMTELQTITDKCNQTCQVAYPSQRARTTCSAGCDRLFSVQVVQPASRFVGVPHQYGRSDIIDNAEEAIDVDTDAAQAADSAYESDQPTGGAMAATDADSMAMMRRDEIREDMLFLAETLRDLQSDLYLALWAIVGILVLFIALMCTMCLCPRHAEPHDAVAERRKVVTERMATAAAAVESDNGVFVVVMDGPIVEPMKPAAISA